MSHTAYFHECEHEGDLDNYIEDLHNSGATILNSDLNYEEETAEVEFAVEDIENFKIAFSNCPGVPGAVFFLINSMPGQCC